MTEKQVEDRLPPFGEEAHRVLARARAAAHRMRHATLGTEHLLLGCAEEARGAAGELLYRAGVAPAELHARAILLGQRTVEPPPPELVMAPELRVALRVAREEAERLRDGEARSEHLLLAILREHTCGGAIVLRAAGLDLSALRAAMERQRLGTLTRTWMASWLARGPYRLLALLGVLAILGAAAFTIRWLVTISPFLRSAYLFDLLIPVALLSIGMVGIGASRVEALRQAAARDALLDLWVARGAAAQVAAALGLARVGALDQADMLLEAAVDREMPDAEVREALSALARWIASEDVAPHGYFARGLLRVHAGQLQAGLADLEAATRASPENPHWQGEYGVWLAKAGRDDEALPVLRGAIRHEPAEPLVTLACAAVLLRRGQPREAVVLARAAAQALPGAARPQAVLATACHLAGAPEEARSSLSAALAADPYDALARAIEAVMLLRQGSAMEALDRVRDAALASIERPGYLTAIEGWALATLGREQDARLAFAQTRERDPALVPTLERMRQGVLSDHLDDATHEIGDLLARLRP